MYLVIAVINEEHLLDDLITGWMGLGILGGTVIESMDMLQYISDHLPIFAGFRSLTGEGMPHNKTLLTVVRDEEVLETAITFMKGLFSQAGKPDVGVYGVTRLNFFGRLGSETPSE